MTVRAGDELLSIRTLRDEMAMSGQFQLAAGGQMLLAAHTQSTGLDNSSYAEEQGEYGEKLNNLTKYVASSKLDDAPWGDFLAATVTRDPVATIRELQEQSGKDIWLWGSLNLMHSLMQSGVVDEVRMLVCPTSRGTGTRIFEGSQDLKLVEALHYGFMADLDDLVPPHEPAEDTFAFAGKAALSLIPVVGPLAAETLAHALETRQAQRQHEFNVAIARALTDAISRTESGTTLEEIVSSDEFVAAVTRAQRAAAETASKEKRRWLAAAVANGGSWAPFSASEREQFTRLVDEFAALHVWLLHYFTDPAAWLRARDLYAQHEDLMMGGIDGPLGTALNAPKDVWHEPVKQAVGDLERAGLAQIPMTTMMSADGVFARRASGKGARFLAFINEPESIDVDPPDSF